MDEQRCERIEQQIADMQEAIDEAMTVLEQTKEATDLNTLKLDGLPGMARLGLMERMGRSETRHEKTEANVGRILHSLEQREAVNLAVQKNTEKWVKVLTWLIGLYLTGEVTGVNDLLRAFFSIAP